MSKVKDLSSSDLIKIQEGLSTLGYYPYYAIDGLWGGMTENGFNAFSNDHWLNNDETGLIGDSFYTTLENEVYKATKEPITKEIIESVSKQVGLEPAVLKGFLEVESRGEAFWNESLPPILYEAHIFYDLTDGRFLNSNLSSRRWNKQLYSGGVKEYERLFSATKLDYSAAYKSCSWGLGQVMGMNSSTLGYRTVTLFVKEAHQSSRNQVNHVIKFLDTNNILKFVANEDWTTVAYRYNGSAYKQNNYDVKLAEAVAKARRKNG